MGASRDRTGIAVDRSRLEAYVAARLPDARDVAVERVRRIAGGLSRETWSFDASWSADGVAVAHEFIVRRDPEASLLDTSRDNEFAILHALEDTDVPVPEVWWLETDPVWLGSPFFVMSRVVGETAPAALLTDPRYDAARASIATRKVEILVALHAIDWEARGIDFLPVPNRDRCGEAEVAKWERVVDEQELEPQPSLRGAIEWCKRHPPPPATRVSIVHGDFRTGNFLFTERGEITAILDWELAHLGDPMEDLAYVATCRFTPEGVLGGVGLVGGLFEREELFARYERGGGATVDAAAVHFWEVLANVKVAAIALTGARAFSEGRTRDLQLAFLGPAAEGLAQAAIAVIERGA